MTNRILDTTWNRDEAPDVLPIMDATSDEEADDRPEPSDLPKVVVDQGYLADDPVIDDRKIRILLGEAMSNQDGRVARMCTAALESDNPTVRSIARKGCAEMWGNRIVKLDPRRRNLEPLYKRYHDDSDDDDVEFSPGDATAMIALLTDTPVEAQSLGIGKGKIVKLVSEKQPKHSPLLPQLVEFSCPMCHRPIFGEDDGETLRVPVHRIREPIFPFGYGNAPHVIQCPASGMEITQLCNGEHDAPSCWDPHCWQLPTEQPMPFSEDLPGEEDPPAEGFLPRPDEWSASEKTTIGHAGPQRPPKLPQKFPQGTPPRK